ncbi:uncharacterized protein LOC123864571 [Maniola jurtina]|uniref:uncharacterized protein LOC123864571 n=1 Tax=Maniola jurtina TaxID=191418 RepID=UPI001E685F64|nr:uncharacterized protein LOC123864571 [Maniola jurtina]
MGRCSKCSKSITKRNVGLECSKCGNLVHATSTCAGLTKKQLSSLKTAENLEWTCNDCSRKSPRRGSFVTPEEDTEDDDDEVESKNEYPISMKKLLTDLTQEIHKIIKKELKETNIGVQFCSEKVDECLECMEAFKEKIKHLEKKNCDLDNKYKAMENKMAALQQRVNDFEQKELCHNIEIIGIPYVEKEDLGEITKTIAKNLKTNVADVKKCKRTTGPPGKPGVLKLQMLDEDTKFKWIKQARSTHLTVDNIISGIQTQAGKEKVYIREELTNYNKALLWQTKQHCKDKYRFVWCKDGKIMVRKSENSKVYIIRAEEDLKNLSSN